ncbi:ethanolamine ammonia-lyase subunit EutC [Clostridium algoriphilum]|uniref:ethanolamine ammonia-lyase subunit EutC n=1 Tax=Clostridium algoriphilum TaxID=198347 RepID=UPI001CF5A5AC|nr:ethanolamine ammonia-lyase subunit EutC [Clostridium algoriphilum]MCB2295479.1 ethanolamine ammonia-lyase subunit EutC [Clostridium algoriphilum]
MENEFAQDISSIDYTSRVTIDNPIDMESCVRLKKTTNARICIGRAGDRFKTETLLRFSADHAVAIDSIWSHVDETIIDELAFLKVQTLIEDKEEYITRPDFGRSFSGETINNIENKCIHKPDVQIIVADGLSSHAIDANIKDIYPIIVDGLNAKGYKLGTPIFVKYGRVATMDKISEALNAKVTILLIGERPGLATGDSMSSYMAYESSTLKPESQRTVVSNIHKNGTPPVEAGAEIVSLVELMMSKQISGVELKI